MLNIHKQLKGFALIEVSIALLILGIISSISINQFATLKRIQADMTTKNNIDHVLKSLGAYYIAKRGILPFPEKIGDRVTGRQTFDYRDFGTVPYKTLGIMEKFVKDGYGNWLKYKVHPDFGVKISKYYKLANKNLGISEDEFDSYVQNDKVAFIIKYTSNNQEHTIWYSENNFVQIFANGKIESTVQAKTRI